MVVLGVENEAVLNAWDKHLRDSGVTCEHFVEPDIGNQKTAIAIHPGADRKMFQRLKLL